MSNHMFLQACLIVSGGVIIGATPKEKTIFTTIARSVQRNQKDWTKLFNGNSLKGWRTYQNKPSDSWMVQDGVLYCKGNKNGQHADLITEEQFENFELSLEWKIAPGANSGILYLVSEKFPATYHSGPEYQLIDDKGFPSKLEDWQKTGANYAMNIPVTDATRRAGEWNTTKIIVNQGHVEHWLNGQKIVEYQLWDENWKKNKANGKWKDMDSYGSVKSGHIALQDHGGEAWFREIKIRKI
ncbi:DUF1080 domain-containing protein [Sediminibacterium sp. KACHI17]